MRDCASEGRCESSHQITTDGNDCNEGQKQIAVEWLHECCHVVLPCESRDAGLRRGVAKRIVMAASKFLGVSRLRGRVGSTIAFCS